MLGLVAVPVASLTFSGKAEWQVGSLKLEKTVLKLSAFNLICKPQSKCGAFLDLATSVEACGTLLVELL